LRQFLDIGVTVKLLILYLLLELKYLVKEHAEAAVILLCYGTLNTLDRKPFKSRILSVFSKSVMLAMKSSR
jgi:hypothetical protein